MENSPLLSAKEAHELSNADFLPDVYYQYKSYSRHIGQSILLATKVGETKISYRVKNDVFEYFSPRAKKMFIDKVCQKFSDLGYDIRFKLKEPNSEDTLDGEFVVDWSEIMPEESKT